MATTMVRPQARGGYVRNRTTGPAASDGGNGQVAEYMPAEMSNRLGAGTPVDQLEPSRDGRPVSGVPAEYTGETYNKTAAPTSAPGYNRYTGNNVEDMISNDRDFAYGRGDELYQNAKDRAANESQVKENYRAYGDEVYDPLIGGRGGYNPEEAAKIDRSGEFDGYMTSQDEYGQNFMTDEEKNAANGNPWERAAYFNPDAADAQQNDSSGKQRSAVDNMETGLYESLDGKLGLSDEYSQGVDRTLAGTAAGARGAYDPAALRADKTSLDRIKMTPEEEQAIVTKAGIDGGMKYRASAGELDRRNRASGGDPIAGAAMRSRYLREGAAGAADAMTAARVAASNARAGREGTAETLRMGGERTAADIGTGVELSLGNQALNANTTKEGLRLGSERDISTRRADLAKTVGQTKLSAEQGINSQQRQVGQFNTTTGTGIATGIEQDAAARAAAIAANRQAASRTNQTQRFGQGTTRIGASSDMAQTVAGARRSDAAEGRGYIRDQQTQANANSQNEYNRQANVYATQGQLAQGTTANQQKKDAQPKWWEKVLAAGAGAAGAMAGGA